MGLIAVRVAVALLLVSTLAMAGACSALRLGAGKALDLQSVKLSGAYTVRQDSAPGQRPTCCSGCARALAPPAVMLSCSRQDPASEPVTADLNAVIAVSKVSLSNFSNTKPQPFYNVPPVRPLVLILNCVMLC